VIDRFFVVLVVAVVLRMALGAGPAFATVDFGITVSLSDQDTGGGGVTVVAVGLVDAQLPVCFIMATKAFGGGQNASIIMGEWLVDNEIDGVGRVTAGAIARAVDCGAITAGSGPEFAVLVQVVAGAATVFVQVGYDIAAGIMASLARAVGGRAHLADVVIGLKVIWVVVGGMAGDAGVWCDNAGLVGDGMACGAASQGDRGNDAGVAGCAAMVVFRTVRIDQGHGEMTGLDAGGVAATDKGAVVWDVRRHPIGMAVETGESD